MSSWIVFGASGGTGREVLAAARAAGHTVTAFVRSPSGVEATRVVVGDVNDAAAVAAAIVGHDAVIVTLGAPASSHARACAGVAE